MQKRFQALLFCYIIFAVFEINKPFSVGLHINNVVQSSFSAYKNNKVLMEGDGFLMFINFIGGTQVQLCLIKHCILLLILTRGGQSSRKIYLSRSIVTYSKMPFK